MVGSLTFTPGDLVVSVYGDGDGSGTYSDNQASPIVLQELTTSGTPVGQLVLPQTTTTVNGVTENAISGEYGSSSEGTLELSGDKQSLTIVGYGVNASTYNAGGAATYGNAALAQSTSVPGGKFTPVARVVADIKFDGTVDTSTSAYNIDNTNNPRSVATTDGSSFYVAGQGVKGDKTQGLFVLNDGTTTTTPTAINNSTDMRTAEIYNGNLYVSTDSKQGPTANIAEYNGLPTAAATPTVLPGISKSVTLGAGQGNIVNGSSGTVNLSPENFYFANATTLYVADGGQPKAGGVGDGGLQKWTLGSNGQWGLDYTLSAGLNVQSNTGTQGTTGLIGLTGVTNTDGTVSLYATNSTIGDLDQTYLYGITDNLAATTPSGAAGEAFKILYVAPTDTNIRGVAFAPQAADVTCFVSGTRIRTADGDIPVEDLQVGDRAVTAAGDLRAIKWLGHRTIDCRRHPRHEVCPIRISAHAFGDGRPARDLFVSPGHAICVDLLGEVFIPAAALANGSTIRQVEVDTVTYWHVELETHDVLLAENLAAESYLDMGNRGFFAESALIDFEAIPDADVSSRSHAGFCRPYHASGPVVAAVQSQLRARAIATGWSLDASDPFADLHLVVDGVRIDPVRRAWTARFSVPAAAKEVWLVTETSRPCDIEMNGDSRALGVCVTGLTIDDGFGAPRPVSLADPLIDVGFHALEDGARRWTAGKAALAPALFAGQDGTEQGGTGHDGVFLRVDLAGPALPRWTFKAGEPQGAASLPDATSIASVASH